MYGWCLILCLGGLIIGSARASDSAFWVWHRDAPLSQSEIERLEASGVKKLFWHVAEVSVDAEANAWKVKQVARMLDAGSFQVIPVFRLEASATPAEDPRRFAALATILAEFVAETQVTEIQIDYDCPDRLLGQYEELLGKCRLAIAPARLSATALAGWIYLDTMPTSVDALYPMFYDLYPDKAAEMLAGKVQALLPEDLDLVRAWRKCTVPWHAGLPNFTRLSLIDAEGASLGHLRSWRWDEVIFHRDLKEVWSSEGATMLGVVRPCAVGDTKLVLGNQLVIRRPSLSRLSKARDIAEEAGAYGVCYFRLNGEAASSGWTTASLLSTASMPPALTLSWNGEQGLTLRLAGSVDLPPRFAGDHGPEDRGWQLEIDAWDESPFRQAAPGDFVKVAAHVDPEASSPVPAPIGKATRLTYWFSHLRVGKALETGKLQRKDLSTPLRWRVGKHQPWKFLTTRP